MTDSLRTKLISVVESVIHLNLSEAETEVTPYAVYEMTVTPVYTKDGIISSSATARITVHGPEFDECDSIRSQIISAIESGMNDDTYSARLLTSDKDCINGDWALELNYVLKQLK